jgi:transposase
LHDRVHPGHADTAEHDVEYCGGRDIEHERVAYQYQEDFPQPQPSHIVGYEVYLGRCRGCGRRIQPRHPDQTSDALGAAGVGLGPRAVALAAWLSKSLGLPASKIARLFGQFGLPVTPGGVTQAVARAARRALSPDALNGHDGDAEGGHELLGLLAH